MHRIPVAKVDRTAVLRPPLASKMLPSSVANCPNFGAPAKSSCSPRSSQVKGNIPTRIPRSHIASRIIRGIDVVSHAVDEHVTAVAAARCVVAAGAIRSSPSVPSSVSAPEVPRMVRSSPSVPSSVSAPEVPRMVLPSLETGWHLLINRFIHLIVWRLRSGVKAGPDPTQGNPILFRG